MTIPGKVAIVTGAGGVGCGRVIAQRFAKEGAAVVVSDIDHERGQEVRQLIEQAGGRAAFFAADLRVEEQVRALVAFAGQAFGGLHILINNASAPFRPGEPLDHWSEFHLGVVARPPHAQRIAIL